MEVNQECCQLSQLQVLVWSLVGAVVFACSWCYTGGGYLCSLPVFIACSLYCYSSDCCRRKLRCNLTVSWLVSVKENCKNILKEDKRCFALISGYFAVKLFLMLLYPAAEKSNGSPLSLIFFTVFFISIYVIPSALTMAFKFRNVHQNGQAVVTSWNERVMPIFKTFALWKKSLLAITVIVVGTYLLDGEISALLRFLGAGRPCWPLLIPKDLTSREKLPPNMLGTVQWHSILRNYKPHWIVPIVISYGRELGEVCHLLPVLIGTFILAQLFLPPKYSQIKKALFACIAGVVLGGATSGTFKILFHRYRPNAYGNPYMWTGPGMTTVNHLKFSKLDLSFPAGHTTVTTAVATCLYVFVTSNLTGVKVSKMVALLLLLSLYTHPVLVLLSRVSDCFHWTSDASFGVGRINTSCYD